MTIEVRGADEAPWRQAFYQFLGKRTGGLPGQTDAWRGKNQWTKPLNSHGDRVGIAVLDDVLILFIRKPWGQGTSAELVARLLHYSRRMRSEMGDQRIDGEPHAESTEGRTVGLVRPWVFENDEDWPAAVDWIDDQFNRLRLILKEPTLEEGVES